MSELHIISGGKGGVGKTLCSLSATLTYLQQHEQVLAIDLNYHNADFSSLLRPLTNNVDYPLGDSGFSITTFKSSGNKKSNSDSYLVYPTPGGRVFGRLPWEGGLGVYRQLETILQKISMGLPGVIGSDFRPEYCIVDTGLHLSNLNPQAKREDYSRKKISQFSKLTSYDLKIWFIWTVAMFDRPDEHEASRKSLRELAEISVGDGKWFNERQNFIHVVNPHVLVPPNKILSFFPEDEVEISSMKSLGKARVVPSITFTSFYSRVGTAITAYDGEDREKYFELIAESIGRPEISNSNTSKWERPLNVFPISVYKRSLAGYTDNFEQKDKYNMEDMINSLGGVYASVHSFLQNISI